MQEQGNAAATITIPRETAYRTLAMIDALEGVVGRLVSPELLDWFADNHPNPITDFFGPFGEADDDFERNPHVVEVWARAAEIEADMLEQPRSGEVWDRARAHRFREIATEYRERGTIAIKF